MEAQTQARISEYLDAYEAIKSKVRDPVVSAAIIEQIGKDKRCDWLSAKGRPTDRVVDNGDVAATQKQLDFMRDLGIVIPDNVSKQEASRLIDEAQAQAY